MADDAAIDDLFGDEAQALEGPTGGHAKTDDGSTGSSSSGDNSSDSGSSSSSDSDSDSDSDAGSDSGKRRVLGKKKRALSKSAKRRPVKPKRALKKRRFGDEADASKPKAKPTGDEGDEYDSDKDVKETHEDRAFIDEEDDDKELMAEYRRDKQDFDDDERPSKSRKGKRDTGEDISGEKKTKAGKRVEMTDEQKRAIVRKLFRTMREAAAQDVADKQAGKPAVAKLKVLPELRTAVANSALHVLLVEGTQLGMVSDADGNQTILTLFRDWLRPLPGSDLPNLQTRDAVYDMLIYLEAKENLGVEYLRESRLGPILFALSEHPQETLKARTKLKVLIDKLSRRIFGRSASYKNGAIDGMLQHQEAVGIVSSSKLGSKVATSRSGAAAAAADAPLPTDDAAMEALLGGAEALAPSSAAPSAPILAKDLPRHARIPAPLMFDYTKRPSNAKVEDSVKPQLGSGASALTKKMVEGKRKQKQGFQRGVKISIEGRGSTS